MKDEQQSTGRNEYAAQTGGSEQRRPNLSDMDDDIPF